MVYRYNSEFPKIRREEFMYLGFETLPVGQAGLESIVYDMRIKGMWRATYLFIIKIFYS